MAEPVTRIGILSACLACVALFVAGVLASVPWLEAENQRLETWKIPIVWLSELTAPVLFLGYVLSLAFSRSIGPRRHGKFALRLFVLGICLDATMTFWSMVDEYAGHGRAVQVQAQVVAGTWRVQLAGDTRFTFTCTFQDRQGEMHTAWFPLVGQTDAPLNVQQAIVAGKLPVPTDVVYDPDWPGRTWLAGLEYSDDGRLFFYSLISLFCSSLLAIALAGWGQEYRYVPSAGTGPFFIMIVLFGIAGFVQGW